MGKTFDDLSLDELLQFEKGKTPKAWIMYFVSLEYLKDPHDPGAISWMRRFYNAMGATRDELYQARMMLNLGENSLMAKTINDQIEFFDYLASNVMAKNITEEDALKAVAVRILYMQMKLYKDPKEMIEKSGDFFENSNFIPPEKRIVLEKIRKMTFRDASALVEAAPIVNKLKSIFTEQIVESGFEAHTTTKPDVDKTNIVNINVQGDVNGTIVVGDNNDLNITQ